MKTIKVVSCLVLGIGTLGMLAMTLNPEKTMANTENNVESVYKRVGEIYQDYSDKVYEGQNSEISLMNGQQDDVAFQGKNTFVTRSSIEKAVKSRMAGGMSEEEARELSNRLGKERMAVYAEAINKGYDVTDEEVWDYIDYLKEELKDNEEHKALRSGFESDEKYWEYEFNEYHINLPVQNYAQGLQDKFMKEHYGSANEFPDEEAYTEWGEYYQKIIDQLVEDENFMEINNVE